MKIAVILPQKPDLHWVWRVKALVNVVRNACKGADAQPVAVVIGLHLDTECPAITRDLARAFEPLADGVRLREFRWEAVDALSASRMFPKLDFDFDGFSTLHVPRDWGWNFRDCDLWIVCPDPSIGGLVPISPTVIFAPDLSERYVPTRSLAAPAERLQRLVSWRRCEGVLSTNEATFDDFVSFVGMSRAKAIQVAPLVPVDEPKAEIGPGSDRDIFVLTRADDPAELELLARTLQIARRRKQNLSVRIAVDATALTREEERERLKATQAMLDDFPADVDDVHTADIVLVSVRQKADWDMALERSRVFLSLALHPGEPAGLLATLDRRPIYVGLETAESRRLIRLSGRGRLYSRADEETIAMTLLEAIASEEIVAAPVASAWRDIATESYANFLAGRMHGRHV